MINAIVEDGTFQARAVTRNPDSESGKALAARGVDVVKGDLDDAAAVSNAVEGAYGVFGVTDFWQAFMKEEQQGKNIVDAAKAAGVKHFVWTTLDHNEEWPTPHFETKARVNDYLIASGVPRTSLYTSFFAENFNSPGIKRNESGKVVMEFPFKTDGNIPVIAASDIGRWAYAAFKDPEQWIGKDLKMATEWITPRKVAQLISEEIGEPVEIKEVDEAKWQASRNEKFEELWLNMQAFYTAGPDYRDVELTNKLLPDATTVKSLIHKWGKSIVH